MRTEDYIAAFLHARSGYKVFNDSTIQSGFVIWAQVHEKGLYALDVEALNHRLVSELRTLHPEVPDWKWDEYTYPYLMEIVGSLEGSPYETPIMEAPSLFNKILNKE